MPIIISSKGNDFNAWRAAGDFGATFREMLLKRTSRLTHEEAWALFQEAGQELERRAAECDADLTRMSRMVEKAAAAKDPALLRTLVEEYYAVAYRFFGKSRSATAFYRLSAEFLRAVCGSLVAFAKGKLGVHSNRIPPMAIIALGPTGRHEYSPFCSLQVAMIHAEPDPSLIQPLVLLGRILHEAFESAGLNPDEVVTPRNPAWRRTPAQWRQWLAKGLEKGKADELIEVLRLADQSTLYDENGLGADFRAACLEQLAERKAAIHNLVNRLQNLSRGIGMMGGIRLERSGPCRGLFGLLDHALLPLSAGITALSLMEGLDDFETPVRIKALLFKGLLNVEKAERLMEAWHLFNELRLAREAFKYPDLSSRAIFCLDIDTLTEEEQEELRNCLESVAGLQRHVAITYNSWEEQTIC